ncbi:MAG: diguanylate cyclase [Paenibacillus sp.]|nr:diguanylate cyclase [Paenibacillus sp.]
MFFLFFMDKKGIRPIVSNCIFMDSQPILKGGLNVQHKLYLSEVDLNLYLHRLLAYPTALTDKKGIILDTNAMFAELAGAMGAVGRSVHALFPYDSMEVHTEGDAHPDPIQSSSKQITVRRADGTESSMHCNAYVAVSEEQEYQLIVLHNHRANGLSLLQQFAGMFIKDVNLGVLLIDNEFTLVDISDTACRILGVDKEQALNHSMDEVFHIVPEEHRLVRRTLLDGVIVRNYAASWTNNAERYELLMDSNLIRDPDGRIVGAYVIFKDVTNLRSLEQQVQRSDRLAMIGQIAAGTAHEIRNPLTSIKGFLQVLQKTFEQTGMEKEHGFTELMLSEIDRINELVNEFLLLSKPRHVSYDKTDMSAVIREVLPIINNQAVLHNVTIRYQSVYQMPKVVADQGLLKQVFINLCKNGIEAMVTGGTLTLTERVDTIGQKVSVDIQDAGPGIPAFLIDKIFDPFFTTKDNGTGLGLSVCQRIIHDIGGSIRVSSKGFGTTFTVTMPYVIE